MTLQEILKAKGMADEVIEAVLGEMKNNNIFTTSHENMDVRYPKLKADHDKLATQYGDSTRRITQLEADAQGYADIQGQVASYQTQIATLTQQVEDQKIEAAMDRILTKSGAKPEDFDYLKFQWRKKGEISLDDNGEIKGGDDAIAGLKTQHPVHFASATDQRELQPHQLHDRNNHSGSTVTKEEFNKMGYKAKVELKQNDPDLYAKLTKG